MRIRSAGNKKASALSVPFSIVDKEVATAVPRQPKERPPHVKFTSQTGGSAQQRTLGPLFFPPQAQATSPHGEGEERRRRAWMPNGNLGAPTGHLPGLVDAGEMGERHVVRPTDIPPTRMMRVAFGEDREGSDERSEERTGRRARAQGAGGGSRGASRGAASSRGVSRGDSRERDAVLRRSRTAEPTLDGGGWVQSKGEWGQQAMGLMRVPAGQQVMMANSLMGTPMGGVPPRARTVSGATRRRGDRDSFGGPSSASNHARIATAAEEFLSLRDAMFSHQVRPGHSSQRCPRATPLLWGWFLDSCGLLLFIFGESSSLLYVTACGIAPSVGWLP